MLRRSRCVQIFFLNPVQRGGGVVPIAVKIKRISLLNSSPQGSSSNGCCLSRHHDRQFLCASHFPTPNAGTVDKCETESVGCPVRLRIWTLARQVRQCRSNLFLHQIHSSPTKVSLHSPIISNSRHPIHSRL